MQKERWKKGLPERETVWQGPRGKGKEPDKRSVHKGKKSGRGGVGFMKITNMRA